MSDDRLIVRVSFVTNKIQIIELKSVKKCGFWFFPKMIKNQYRWFCWWVLFVLVGGNALSSDDNGTCDMLNKCEATIVTVTRASTSSNVVDGGGGGEDVAVHSNDLSSVNSIDWTLSNGGRYNNNPTTISQNYTTVNGDDDNTIINKNNLFLFDNRIPVFDVGGNISAHEEGKCDVGRLDDEAHINWVKCRRHDLDHIFYLNVTYFCITKLVAASAVFNFKIKIV